MVFFFCGDKLCLGVDGKDKSLSIILSLSKNFTRSNVPSVPGVKIGVSNGLFCHLSCNMEYDVAEAVKWVLGNICNALNRLETGV